MPGRRFLQVDVFTTEPLTGNPAAVVLDADGLDADTMQRIAREMNLSETVFVLPPASTDGDYRARIFTPRAELDFAGHPTIGCAHALREVGRIPSEGTVVQECGAGLVPVEISGGLYTLTAPPATFADPPVAFDHVVTILGCEKADVLESSLVDVGVEWLTVRLSSGARVAALHPDLSAMEREALDITVFAAEDGDAFVRVRSFAPAHGIPEDPVCGSGNVCVAAMLARSGDLPPGGSYSAVQGEECGRPGRLELRVEDDGRVRLGGRAVTVISGEIRIP